MNDKDRPLLNPHEIRHCETCGTSLKGRRSDIKYCSDKCRVLGNQRKKQTEAGADSRETPPTQVRPDAHTQPPQEPIEVQAEEVFALPTYEAVKSGQVRIEDLPIHVQTLFREIDEKKQRLEKLENGKDIIDKTYYDTIERFAQEKEFLIALKAEKKQQVMAEKQARLEEAQKNKLGFFKALFEDLKDAFSENNTGLVFLSPRNIDKEITQIEQKLARLRIMLKTIETQKKEWQEKIKEVKKEIARLQNYKFRLVTRKDFLPNAHDTPKTKPSPTMTMPHIKRTSPEPEPEPETTEPYKPEPHKHTFNGTDLRRMQKASIIELPYSCNEYFGDLTRQMCFIALSGNAGAGKTHFSFFVVHCFDLIGYKVKYFSLECGISNQVIDLAQDNKLSKRFSISEKATAQDIAEAAQNFDVVVIDSFGKAFKNATEIDNLRQAYPETIFICIFQQTTEGTLRGGSAVSYDCSAEWKIIQDKENQTRTLHIIKSRYGNGGKSVDITGLNPKRYAK